MLVRDDEKERHYWELGLQEQSKVRQTPVLRQCQFFAVLHTMSIGHRTW
jgi:hypothetical protein